MRITIDLDGDNIQALMEETGLQTEQELFNWALTELAWTVSEIKRGRKVASFDEAKHVRYELRFPFFENIQRLQ